MPMLQLCTNDVVALQGTSATMMAARFTVKRGQQ